MKTILVVSLAFASGLCAQTTVPQMVQVTDKITSCPAPLTVADVPAEVAKATEDFVPVCEAAVKDFNEILVKLTTAHHELEKAILDEQVSSDKLLSLVVNYDLRTGDLLLKRGVIRRAATAVSKVLPTELKEEETTTSLLGRWWVATFNATTLPDFDRVLHEKGLAETQRRHEVELAEFRRTIKLLSPRQ